MKHGMQFDRNVETSLCGSTNLQVRQCESLYVKFKDFLVGLVLFLNPSKMITKKGICELSHSCS